MEGTRTFAVLAHYDPHGLVAPHVIHMLHELSSVADRLVVCSTAKLTKQSRTELGEFGQVIERENRGYDFYSWREALLGLDRFNSFERIIVANDSTVGPLRPLREIVETTSANPTDFWAITASFERHPDLAEDHPHLQSYLMGFESSAINSDAFARFWQDMQPARTRTEAILNSELRITRILAQSGLRYRTYFRPTNRDLWQSAYRRFRSRGDQELRDFPRFLRSARSDLNAHAGNPMTGLWDRALVDERLPYVKIEVLRDDPYGLGSERMLRRCEERWPVKFTGVRDYIERTRSSFNELRQVP